MPMMDSEDTMQGETGMSTDKPGMGNTDSGDEPMSVFLPKAALDGRTVKPGDTLTLKVKDIDPESGEVEAVCDYEEQDKSEGGMMDDFDSAMPADGEGQ